MFDWVIDTYDSLVHAVVYGQHPTSYWRVVRNGSGEVVEIESTLPTAPVHAGEPSTSIIPAGIRLTALASKDRQSLWETAMLALSSQQTQYCTQLLTTLKGASCVLTQRVEPAGPDALKVTAVSVAGRQIVTSHGIEALSGGGGQAIADRTSPLDAFGTATMLLIRESGLAGETLRIVATNAYFSRRIGLSPDLLTNAQFSDTFPFPDAPGLTALVHYCALNEELARFQSSPSQNSARLWSQLRIVPISASQIAITLDAMTDPEISDTPTQEPIASVGALPELRQEVDRRIRTYSRGNPSWLVLLNFDRFHLLNSRVGSRMLAELLDRLGRLLVHQLPEDACVTRVSDDAVGVVLGADPMDPLGVIVDFNHLVDQLEFDLAHEFPAIRVALYGGARALDPGCSVPDALGDCAVAAEHAHTNGGRHVDVFYPGLSVSVLNRRFLGDSLRFAITNGEFFLEYQPIVMVSDAAVYGYEAYARWLDPITGLRAPASFIPVTESSGSIIDLTDWVMEQALADHPIDGSLIVNMSPVFMTQGDPVRAISAALARNDFDPANLVLEFTMSAFLDASPLFARHIERIRELGVRISLDDFGTGYSALSSLRNLPVDIVKIDMHLFRGNISQSRLLLLQSCVDVIHEMNATSILKGIENQEQLDFARQAGVQLVQGFLFGRPQPHPVDSRQEPTIP
ncbi:MAG: EAL domain-containing protein [Candidatus Nanopelagicales bacterium]